MGTAIQGGFTKTDLFVVITKITFSQSFQDENHVVNSHLKTHLVLQQNEVIDLDFHGFKKFCFSK